MTQSPRLEPNQIFLEKPENVCLAPSNLTELERRRDEEKKSRYLPNDDEQSLSHQIKRLEVVKVLQQSTTLRV